MVLDVAVMATVRGMGSISFPTLQSQFGGEEGKTIEGQMLKRGLETKVPWEQHMSVPLKHGSLCASALQLQSANNGIALHPKNTDRPICQGLRSAQIHIPGTRDMRNIIFRIN